MTIRPLAWLLLYLAGLGTALSGYLTYETYFTPIGCGQSLLTCGAEPVKILGLPQCLLGLMMFVAVGTFVILLMVHANTRRWLNGLVWLGLAGTLFAGGLSYYELWIQTPAPTVMPACVFGFFLYLGILLGSWFARNEIRASSLSTNA